MEYQSDKEYIKSQIDETADRHLLNAIKSLLEYASNSEYESGLKPFKRTELVKRAKISNRNISSGRTKSLKRLKKESESW